LEQIALLLKNEAGNKALFVEHPEGPDAVQLLESYSQPYRSLFSVDLRDGGDRLGKLTLIFASEQFQGSFPQRLSDFVGEQLGMLLARTRLAERRAQLKAEIAQMDEDLLTRKLMQRAEGLLMARRGMLASVARNWIAQQSHKTGLSKNDVADRIIAYYQATGLLDQKIA
jgi:GAF domain-containing protein